MLRWCAHRGPCSAPIVGSCAAALRSWRSGWRTGLAGTEPASVHAAGSPVVICRTLAEAGASPYVETQDHLTYGANSAPRRPMNLSPEAWGWLAGSVAA